MYSLHLFHLCSNYCFAKTTHNLEEKKKSLNNIFSGNNLVSIP